ncbi:hypothetical protein ACIBUR_28585 [Streptomyces anulatus]
MDVGIAGEHQAQDDLPLRVGPLPIEVALDSCRVETGPDHFEVERADGREGGRDLQSDPLGVDLDAVMPAERRIGGSGRLPHMSDVEGQAVQLLPALGLQVGVGDRETADRRLRHGFPRG